MKRRRWLAAGKDCTLVSLNTVSSDFVDRQARQALFAWLQEQLF